MTISGETFTIAAPDPNGAHPSLRDDLVVVTRALTTRWRLIVLTLLLGVIAGIAVMWVMPPTYRSSVDILVDPRARTLVGMDVVPGGLGSSSYGSDTALVDSQLQLVQSRAVLAEVVSRLRLDESAAPAPGPLAPVMGLLKFALYGPRAAEQQGATPEDRAITALQSALKVERLGNTYVLRVTAAARDAEAAADIANEIAAVYLQQGQEAIDRETEQTSQALEDRLTQLKASSVAAQQALESYRAANGLIDTQGLQVDEQQLRDLNERATQAATDEAAAQARFDEVERLKGLKAAQIAASNSLSSPTADALREQLTTALADETSLAGLYGPQHPTLVQARNRRAALEKALMQEFRRIEARASSELKTAQNSSAALKQLLADAESRRATSNTASIRLRELQTAADNAKSIYDAFALRAAQTREQIDLPTNTARVIAAAEANAQPTDPKLPVVLGIAAAGSLALGTGLAWLLHLLFGTPASPQRGPTIPVRVPRPTAPVARPHIVPAAPPPAPVSERNLPVKPRRRPIHGLFR